MSSAHLAITQCRQGLGRIEADTRSLDSAVWAEPRDWRGMRELFNKVRQEAERVVDDLDRDMISLEEQE